MSIGPKTPCSGNTVPTRLTPGDTEPFIKVKGGIAESFADTRPALIRREMLFEIFNRAITGSVIGGYSCAGVGVLSYLMLSGMCAPEYFMRNLGLSFIMGASFGATVGGLFGGALARLERLPLPLNRSH